MRSEESFHSKTPFFIIGTGRCGSTYLGRLLEAHESVVITNEAGVADFLAFCSRYASVGKHEWLDFHKQVTHVLPGLVDRTYNSVFSEIFDRHAAAILAEFYSTVFADREFTHWGDKLPDPDAVIAARAIWPQTRLITLIRDPRDVVSSWFSYGRREEVRSEFPFIAEQTSHQWATLWQNTYAGFRKHFPDTYEVLYEDLVRDPVGVLRPLLGHLGLELKEDHVEAMGEHELFAQHGTSATVEKTMQRWRRDLEDSDVVEIESVCGELMGEYGYELSGLRG